MAQASPLPERLRYLGPVRKQFARLAARDNLHEDTDLSVLRRVVRKRVKGLSSEQSRIAMAEDGASLERWLATPEAQNEPLHFLLPILADAMEVLFPEPTHEPPERGVVRMELPAGAKVTEENGCWSVKWQKKLAFSLPLAPRGDAFSVRAASGRGEKPTACWQQRYGRYGCPIRSSGWDKARL